jgi:hypothetical protein
MKLAFWKKEDPRKLEAVSWNLMVAAIDPDRCWEIAGLFRETGIPGSVRTCEVSFLMGSLVRDILRNTISDRHRAGCIRSAEAAYFQTFDEQSDDPLPAEMARIYGARALGDIAREALAQYAQDGDMLLLTSATLVHRLRGDPRMKYEISPLFEERASALQAACAKAIR